MSAEHPIVLVLEDLHWADTASLDLLRFLARSLASLSLLLVVTYRDEEVDRRHPLATLLPLLMREAPVERIDLRSLDAAASRALVVARYDLAAEAASRLAAFLIDRTEGNALFMTELLRTLEGEGLLHRHDGQWQVETIAHTPVPRLLAQIVDARLARLGDDADALLAVAAVIGQKVPLAVWAAVTQVDEETLTTLAERAEAAHLVTAWPNGAGIGFTHALIREILYESMPALRRRRLHRQVGEALLALPAPDPDDMAYQFQQAGDARAIAWLVRAGERAEAAFARRTAAERYEAAVEILRDADRAVAEEFGWLQLRAAILRRYEDSGCRIGLCGADTGNCKRSRRCAPGRLCTDHFGLHARVKRSFGAAPARGTDRHGGACRTPFARGEEQRAREAPYAAHPPTGSRSSSGRHSSGDSPKRGRRESDSFVMRQRPQRRAKMPRAMLPCGLRSHTYIRCKAI